MNKELEINFDLLFQYTQGLSVLFVEDSKIMRNAILKKLEFCFQSVEVSSDGREAWDTIQRYYKEHNEHFDIIITDLDMPDMDGMELISLVLNFNPMQEIIVISSYGNFKKMIDLVKLGVHKFLDKPFLDHDLYIIISDVAKSINAHRIHEDEKMEIGYHNAVLKEREKIYLNNIEELSVAIDESTIVSKTDTSGIITYVNKAFCDISGYSENEIIGKKHSMFNSGLMDASYYKELWSTITRKKIFKGVMKNRAKDGSIYYFSVTIKPLLNLNSQITEYMAIGHDVTAMTVALEELREEKEFRSHFLRNIGHEMSTPLNAIISLASLSKMQCSGNDKVIKMLNVIQEGGNTLYELVRNLIDFQSYQMNKLDPVNEVFNMEKTLAPLLEKVEKKSNAKQQNFKLSIEALSGKVFRGNSYKLIRLLDTLLDNAIKFTPSRGNIELLLSLNEDLCALKIVVHDNGIGIDTTNTLKIFEFHQLNSNLNRSYEGIGLGLALAKEIIDSVKGSVRVESSLGNGAKFTVIYPIEITA
jgi:PAS domain S-box-containing protein